MTKALISNLNTIWGVIAKPQSSNVYRHILSFDTPALKDEFINSKIFPNDDGSAGDYKALLDSQPEISFTQVSSMESVVTINPNEYPNETDDSLFNKDFMIISENGVIKFYAITNAERLGTQIVYSCELDIFFTYDIKDMFNNNQARISRAMLDRYDINNDVVEPIYIKDKTHSSIIYNTEPIDQNIKDNLIPLEQYTLDKTELYNEIIDPAMSDDDKAKLLEILEESVSPVVASRLSKNGAISITGDETGTNYSSKNEESYNQPFSLVSTFSFKNIRVYVQDEKNEDFRPFNTSPNDPNNNQRRLGSIRRFSPEELEDASTIKTSYSLTSRNILALILKSIKDLISESASWKYLDFFGISKIPNSDAYALNVNYRFFHNESGRGGLIPIFSVVPRFRLSKSKYSGNGALNDPETFLINVEDVSQDMVESKVIVDEVFKTTNIGDININNKHDNHKYEVKSLSAPYNVYKIKSSSKNIFDVLPQYLTSNKIDIKYNFGFLTEQWTQWAIIKDYYNNKYLGELPASLDYMFEDVNNYSLATDINAWEEFIATNKAQQSASFMNKGISAGLGAIGAIATGGVSAIALGSIALKSANDINQQMSQRKDIQNTPDKLVNSGSILLQDIQIKSIKPKLYKYGLNDIDKTLINEFFYKYGYNFNSKLQSIPNLLKTRYYFNYVEVLECFENIKMQLSAEIKQIINDTMESGVTIWHIRDLATFKGIKNYEYENAEMSIVNNPVQNDEPIIPKFEWKGIVKAKVFKW